MRKRKRDYYYRKAKKEKYRSRAAYKLLQTAQRYQFLKRGDIVLDLGTTPGGWLQAARRIVGTPGFVLGVDLKKTAPLNSTNVHTLVGDITDKDTQALIEEILPAKPDVVVSDVSPNVSGVWEVDHARQIDLARESLKLAQKLLRKGGSFFVKVFQGDMSQDFIGEVRNHFVRVEIIKPEASRSKSAEVYVLGMGLKEGKGEQAAR